MQYRRIIICGVIPLCSTVNATRASLGVVLAILSLMYFREERPYREKQVNFIAYVAQFAILVTFYAALSIDTNVMMDFGLKDLGMGLFLCAVTLSVLGLAAALGVNRVRRHSREERIKQSKAAKVEDASTFTANKFRTTVQELLRKLLTSFHTVPLQ